MAYPPPSPALHIALFPFMSKGHTIPIIHLTRLLLNRGLKTTVFTTPANRPFISDSLTGTDASVIVLPFPENIPGIPSGTESTDKLPSMSLFVQFANATKLIQPHFEQAIKSLPNLNCMISDGFLSWTLQSASKFGIPRLVFYGMNNYSMALNYDVTVNRLLSIPKSDNEPFVVPNFPWIKLTKNDFEEPFNEVEPKGPYVEFTIEQSLATFNSYGLIVNSFFELEKPFVEYWNRASKPKAWCIGPLCFAEPEMIIERKRKPKPKWIDWLDQKRDQGKSVLYVAFGSQAEISQKQLHEIAMGLEKSEVNFLWVMRKKDTAIEGVPERGMVVRDWVDQREVLAHEGVRGFLTHCGWNSVLESIWARVPILAWPMIAEQHLNARMVVEEIKIGLRVETIDGSVRGFVKRESLEKMVRELMEGDMGKEVRKKVEEVGEAAGKAMTEGGSSWDALNQLIDEIKST